MVRLRGDSSLFPHSDGGDVSGDSIVDGYELIRNVRALPTECGGRVPAVALTAYARAENRLRAVRAGYRMHITKPVEAAELVALVASLGGRSGRA